MWLKTREIYTEAKQKRTHSRETVFGKIGSGRKLVAIFAAVFDLAFGRPAVGLLDKSFGAKFRREIARPDVQSDRAIGDP